MEAVTDLKEVCKKGCWSTCDSKSMGQKKCIEGIFMGETLEFLNQPVKISIIDNLFSFERKT